MTLKNFFAHDTAVIDPEVEIGTGTTIWHFSHVLSRSTVGRDCRIGQNVVIGPDVRVGNNVKIQNNVSVYAGVTLEDDVFCGPSMVFTNVLTPRAAFPRNHAENFAPTLVRRGASIGANATIVCGHTIGEYAMVGAGAVVTKDVRPHSLVLGNPARHAGWVCECGARLKFDGASAACGECQRKYSTIGDGIELSS